MTAEEAALAGYRPHYWIQHEEAAHFSAATEGWPAANERPPAAEDNCFVDYRKPFVRGRQATAKKPAAKKPAGKPPKSGKVTVKKVGQRAKATNDNPNPPASQASLQVSCAAH